MFIVKSDNHIFIRKWEQYPVLQMLTIKVMPLEFLKFRGHSWFSYIMYFFRLEKRITSFLEDQDPESKLEVGADMRKIHHCFHYLKVNLNISTSRSHCLPCSNCNKAFLVDQLLKCLGPSFPCLEQCDLRINAERISEFLQRLYLTSQWVSSDHGLLKLLPGISTFYTE